MSGCGTRGGVVACAGVDPDPPPLQTLPQRPTEDAVNPTDGPRRQQATASSTIDQQLAIEAVEVARLQPTERHRAERG